MHTYTLTYIQSTVPTVDSKSLDALKPDDSKPVATIQVYEMCVCVCVRACEYIYIFMYICICTHVYVYV